MRRSSDVTDSRYVPNPETILNKLRVFCGKYFFETDIEKKKRYQTVLIEYLKPRIIKLFEKVNTDVLNVEPSLIQVKSPIYVFGDLHGNVFDLYYYEQRMWGSGQPKKQTRFAFLGDFMDRGKFSVEVVVYLFALKLSNPKKFLLIRGNHEIRSCNKDYTLKTECDKKFGTKFGEEVFEKMNDCFSRLPLAMVIDRSIFCCHGGISSTYATLEKIGLIEKPLVSPHSHSKTAQELLWNDPIESMTTYSKKREEKLKTEKTEFIFNRARNTGKYYTYRAVKKFLRKNKLDYVIRAHEAEKKGFKFHSRDTVITIFSSSRYDGMYNTTACVEVTKRTIRIVVLKDPHKQRDRKIYSEETMNKT